MMGRDLEGEIWNTQECGKLKEIWDTQEIRELEVSRRRRSISRVS